MFTKKVLFKAMNAQLTVGCLALFLALQNVNAAPSANLAVRERSGTAALPFSQKPGTAAGYSASGTQQCSVDKIGGGSIAYAVSYSVTLSAQGNANNGTYRFIVTQLTASTSTAGCSIVGLPSIQLDAGDWYSQGQTFSVRYWASAHVARMVVKVGGLAGQTVPTTIPLDGTVTAPGWRHWDAPGEYIQTVLGGYGYSSGSWFDRSYYGNPSAAGTVQFQVVEWRANCGNLTPGTTYYLQYSGWKRLAGTSTWYDADVIRDSFVAVGGSMNSNWVGVDYVPHAGPCWEYLFYNVAISTDPFTDSETPPIADP